MRVLTYHRQIQDPSMLSIKNEDVGPNWRPDLDYRKAASLELECSESSDDDTSNLTIRWDLKYQPHELAAVIGNEFSVMRLDQIGKMGFPMNILAVGPRGVGKRTAVLCLARSVTGIHFEEAVLELDGSSENIDQIIERIYRFVENTNQLGPEVHKIVILDAADRINISDRDVKRLNYVFWTHSAHVRYAFICNNFQNTMTSYIRFTCEMLPFGLLHISQILTKLIGICLCENLPYSPQHLALLAFAANGDMHLALDFLKATFYDHRFTSTIPKRVSDTGPRTPKPKQAEIKKESSSDSKKAISQKISMVQVPTNKQSPQVSDIGPRTPRPKQAEIKKESSSDSTKAISHKISMVQVPTNKLSSQDRGKPPVIVHSEKGGRPLPVPKLVPQGRSECKPMTQMTVPEKVCGKLNPEISNKSVMVKKICEDISNSPILCNDSPRRDRPQIKAETPTFPKNLQNKLRQRTIRTELLESWRESDFVPEPEDAIKIRNNVRSFIPTTVVAEQIKFVKGELYCLSILTPPSNTIFVHLDKLLFELSKRKNQYLKMEQEMTEFYKSGYGYVTMPFPTQHLKIGYHVVFFGMENNELFFKRAVIKSPVISVPVSYKNDGKQVDFELTIRIELIDFGFEFETSVEDLTILDQRFAVLPPRVCPFVLEDVERYKHTRAYHEFIHPDSGLFDGDLYAIIENPKTNGIVLYSQQFKYIEYPTGINGFVSNEIKKASSSN